MRKSIENLSGRKFTGGRIIPNRTRRKYEIDRYPNEPIVGETKNIVRRVRGHNIKVAFKFAEYANVSDQESKKTTKVKIITVSKNPANKDFERRGVITKGSILETELGLARVVSRPGQDGVVNAILVKQ
ncbi:30S ribosomal protein S8e [Candidatus Nitrosocosmicus agrestis]|uniref:30S ribosomal protein S8e n=1 Tax=Candidatus Nitrosocosmicus agrestis TaxID=2563600 RepID=UPI00122E9782|nr:30S ribosomal protein S8e [Candidatus Nitrosocosmicus sp. SS]KAA2279561.1 30S ribosomal protein S8e [Candidatus Nitrosocosmicus sp. SS]KAF0868157.1 30S ribosomal protein S8e [Candidatus Nitrosocosmicus sp. SS]